MSREGERKKKGGGRREGEKALMADVLFAGSMKKKEPK